MNSVKNSKIYITSNIGKNLGGWDCALNTASLHQLSLGATYNRLLYVTVKWTIYRTTKFMLCSFEKKN